MPLDKWLRNRASDDNDDEPTPIELAARAGRLLHIDEARAELAAAWAHIARRLEIETDPAHSLGEMMEAIAASAVNGSEAQRALFERALDSGAPLSSAVLNAMAEQLQKEGHGPEEVHALVEELRAHGVPADAQTAERLVRSTDLLKFERQRELQRILTLPRSPSGIEEDAAWAIFERLVQRGEAHTAHLRVMLRRAAGDEGSEDQLALLRRVVSASGGRVKPNVHVYTAMMTRLQLEGRLDEAAALIQRARADGLHVDARMSAAQRRAPLELSRMRTRKLVELLSDGTPRSQRRAARLFDTMVAQRAVDQHQLGVMLSRSHASLDEMRALMRRVEAAGVPPATPAFNALLSRIQIEGRPVSELGAVVEEMREAGVEADEHTRRVLSYAETDLSAMRTAALCRLLRLGCGSAPEHARARLDAWQLFAGLLERGQLDMFQLNTMRASAHRAASGHAGGGALAEEREHVATFERAERWLRGDDGDDGHDDGGVAMGVAGSSPR